MSTARAKSTRNAAAPRMPRTPRRRVAIGPPRPTYLHEENDRMMMMITALAAEVSALRERLDTHEALGERRQFPTAKAVEGFKLTAARRAGREAGRQALLSRVFRILMEDLDAARNDPAPDADALLREAIAE